MGRLAWVSLLSLVLGITACGDSGGTVKADARRAGDAGGNSGACQTTCNAPSMCCAIGSAAFCIDTSADTSNCGSCGDQCSATAANSCSNGKCACGAGPACSSGSECCSVGGVASCAATDSDPNNCGSCGHSCNGGTCVSGQCSGGGQLCAGAGRTCTGAETCCPTGCFDTTSDPSNCGGCGNACQQGDTCDQSSCGGAGGTCDQCSFPLSDCCTVGLSGPCTTLFFDPNNCGACDNVCPGDSPNCCFGACQADSCF